MKNNKPYLLSVLMLLLFFNAMAQFDCTDHSKLIPQDSIIICNSTNYRLEIPPQMMPLSYTWKGGASTSFIDITQTDWYRVTASDGTCVVEDSVYVVFNSLIQIPKVSNKLLCVNQPAAALEATGENLKWYNSPITTAGSNAAPIPSTADTGAVNYYVSQTILGCESPRAKIIVEVIDAPKFDLGDDVVIPCGAAGVLLQTVEQKYTTYAWQDGTTRPDFTAMDAGKYVLQAENICGRLIDTVTTVGCNTRCVNFPTAFTPNNDGLNETFKAGAFCPISKFKLMVFNRFGQKVFETLNPTNGWDGRINGKRADQGIYTYYCVYDDFMLKRELLLKGSVTIMK